MQLSQLATFCKVVEQKSFSGAAGKLGLTKSTVSRQVALLEASMGLMLLQRNTRQLSLTEAGLALYERCAPLLLDVAQSARAVQESRAKPAGSLRVAAPTAYGRLYVAPLLGDFMRRYPEVNLELLFVDREVDLIEERLDIAVLLGRPPSPGMIAFPLQQSRRTLCASPQYLELAGTPAEPEDLKHYNCLVCTEAGGGDRWRLRGPAGVKVLRVSGQVRANSGEALMGILLSGVGIGYPPAFASAPYLRTGQLRAVLPDWGEEMMPSHLVCLPNRYPAPPVRCFLDFFLARIGKQLTAVPSTGAA